MRVLSFKLLLALSGDYAPGSTPFLWHQVKCHWFKLMQRSFHICPGYRNDGYQVSLAASPAEYLVILDFPSPLTPCIPLGFIVSPVYTIFSTQAKQAEQRDLAGS